MSLASSAMASDVDTPSSSSLMSEPDLELVSAAATVEDTDPPHEPIPKPDLEYILDPRGDLWLHTRGKDAQDKSNSGRFRVCSRTVARASPVLDKMLYGWFAERLRNQAQGQEWVVELPEDTTSAMRSLLEIMHGQFQHIKPVVGAQKQTIRSLYDIIVAAHKYDCIKMLRPWAASWIACRVTKDTETHDDLLQSAWIFYQLGSREEYEAVVTSLILNFPPACQGAAVPVLPPNLEDTVKNLRVMMSKSLLDPLRASLDRLTEQGSEVVGLCKHSKAGNPAKITCESYMLGDWIRGLRSNQLWPIPADSDIHRCASSVDTIITNLFAKSCHVYDNQFKDCKLVAQPLQTRQQAGNNEFTYSKDYKYQASKGEIAHMARQAEVTALHLHAPDQLAPKGNVLFPFHS
ncbi:armadillo repeat-containing protein 5 [Microdochium nivale]|nr:armadillo repeat-containing protein 5 [Microdochium nivale]